MAKITRIWARQVLDSRGEPTVEAEIWCGNAHASAIVPSGASTGTHEALELRDCGKEFNGKAVTKAVSNVNRIIAPKLIGMDAGAQQEIDKKMIGLDGTGNKSKLGANAMLAVSMACARLSANISGQPLYAYLGKISGNSKFILPVPQMNVINGGRHAGIENDVQEHLIAPAGCKNFSEALRAGAETYHALKGILKKKFGAQGILVADEGGFVPAVSTVSERLALMESAAKEAGWGNEILLALDCASSEFYENGKYRIGGKAFSSAELVDFYKEIASSHKIYSIEDGMAESDWQGWAMLTRALGKKVQIVADDLTVTNPKIIREAVSKKAANALLLKVNQIGTVTEALEAGKIARDAGWGIVVSHRSGESEDSFIADLAVGLGAGQSKFGAPARGERTCKYNQLLRIEEALAEKGKAKYAGKAVLRR